MTESTADLQVNPSDEVISVGGAQGALPAHGRQLDRQRRGIRTVCSGRAASARAYASVMTTTRKRSMASSGVMTWTVNGKPIDVGPGQALCIPRGAIHRFDNNTSQDVKALCLITPAALGPQYFRETAAALNAAAGGPPDRAMMIEIMLRHGLTPAPPQA